MMLVKMSGVRENALGLTETAALARATLYLVLRKTAERRVENDGGGS